MGLTITTLSVLVLLASCVNAALSPEAIDAALKLPSCVTQCAIDNLPRFNCTIGDPCYCAMSGPVEDAMASCVIGGCPSLGDALEGLKFQALTCDYRTDRNVGPLTSGVAYALFGLATLFLCARFLSRWPRLRGAGLSWDDGEYLASMAGTGLTRSQAWYCSAMSLYLVSPLPWHTCRTLERAKICGRLT